MPRTISGFSVGNLARAAGFGRRQRATTSSASRTEASFIAHRCAPRVAKALRRIGRTEDIQFSPDNTRLAICGFNEGRVLVLDVERRDVEGRDVEGRARVRFPRHVELVCAAFDYPHGVAWLDGETLVVANRHAEVVVCRVPAAGPDGATVAVEPSATIRADAVDGLSAPGSVAAIDLGAGRFEILVCNNEGNTVSSHLLHLGRDRGDRIESSVTLLGKGLLIPDSIALGPRARWIAVSNHCDHSVFLYENALGLNAASDPAGTLRGVLYPHGLRFSADGRRVVVADAGAPFVHVFASHDGDWRGIRYPELSLRLMDDATFERGRYNPQEGGPKGVDLSSDGAILVATCDAAPFVCVDIRGMGLASRTGASSAPIAPPRAAMSFGLAAERHRRIKAQSAAEIAVAIAS